MQSESMAVADAVDVHATDTIPPTNTSRAAFHEEDTRALPNDGTGDAEVRTDALSPDGAGNANSDARCETIGGFQVHEAAALFPLLEGEQFDELVGSIRANGQRCPVVLHNGRLLEGRNRTRAVERLREQGLVIELKTVEWNPRPGESAAQYVADANLHRRHLRDDQRLQIAARLLPMIEAERTAAQKESRIKPGQVLNPHGRNGTSATRKADVISLPPSERKALNKTKVDRSTVGKLAAMTNQTPYAAARAMKIERQASPEDCEAIRAGKKSAKAVAATLKKKPAGPRNTPKKLSHPFTPKTPLQHDLLAGWIRLRDAKVAINERQQARDAMRAIFKAEEADKPTAASRKKKSEERT